MNLRTATAQDADALVGLICAFRNHLERAAPSEAQFLESVGRLLSGEDAEFSVAEAEGACLGYVLLRFRYSLWAQGLEATLEDLFVTPGHQGGGVGRRLVEFALAQAQARGCTSVCLDTNEHNAASTRIYESLGFSAISRRWRGRQVFYRLKLAASHPQA